MDKSAEKQKGKKGKNGQKAFCLFVSQAQLA
jgi:hypothetical protein